MIQYVVDRRYSHIKGGDEVRMVMIALIFNFLDFATGLIQGFKSRSINSTKLRDGLFKKIGFVLCYVLSFIIDNYCYMIGFNLGFDTLPVIVSYVVLTEIVSIVENICEINPDLSVKKLLDLLNIKEG